MSTEARLKAIEDRLALQDVVNAYCTAVDKLSDIEGLVGLFTADAVFDLSAIHLPRVEGHAGIRGFFQPVFEMMTHHAHYWSNFRIDRLQPNEASLSAYVSQLIEARSNEDDLEAMLDQMLEETGGPPTREEIRWADEALGIVQPERKRERRK